MYRITFKEELAKNIVQFNIEAPRIAKKASPGQFVIVRLNEQGERIPLTIADFDREKGTITLVIQEIGYSSKRMCAMQVGDSFLDVTGPLGQPSQIQTGKVIVFVAGGLGIAPVYPIARACKEAGNTVIIIMGAKSKDLLIWEDQMRSVSDELLLATDDGSAGVKGFVTNVLTSILAEKKVDTVIAIGPGVMMAAVAKVVPKTVELVVSINTIMVDGTGMCGACRVTVAGKTRFACVEGPDFDGHAVDWQEFLARGSFYKKEEEHMCKIGLN